LTSLTLVYPDIFVEKVICAVRLALRLQDSAGVFARA
jgi:hypothetical protein